MYRFKFHHGFIGRYISDIWGYAVFCHCWCAQLPPSALSSFRAESWTIHVARQVWQRGGCHDRHRHDVTSMEVMGPTGARSYRMLRCWDGMTVLILLVLGNGWVAGRMRWLLIVIMDHSRKFPAFRTSKWFIMCALAEFKSNADMWIMWMRPAQTIWIILTVLTHNNHRWLISLPPQGPSGIAAFGADNSQNGQPGWWFDSACCLPHVQHN